MTTANDGLRRIAGVWQPLPDALSAQIVADYAVPHSLLWIADHRHVSQPMVRRVLTEHKVTIRQKGKRRVSEHVRALIRMDRAARIPISRIATLRRVTQKTVRAILLEHEAGQYEKNSIFDVPYTVAEAQLISHLKNGISLSVAAYFSRMTLTAAQTVEARAKLRCDL